MNIWELYLNIGLIVVGYVGMGILLVRNKKKKELSVWDKNLFCLAFSFCAGSMVNMLLKASGIW
ncbi:hypothetical protein COO03_05000 [Bacillus sp. AFS098217]|uniref:hypothetical protein n=1 Tax=Bacillus sp. AFS098217 TaxID=2033868 RepID=UPI000BEE260E|nr:hypothetical protein [Bacillus sp. AFS098217]PEB54600.1 hypothetical protein COO03_05000 [Bacillus sp. AFS098217]